MDIKELGDKAAKDLTDQQNKIVESLKIQVRDLTEKNNELQTLLNSSSDIKTILSAGDMIISHEEIICLKQLQMLKTKSDFDELTYEETKKVEVFSNILAKLKLKGDPIDKKIKEFKSEDLILLINNDDTKEQSK